MEIINCPVCEKEIPDYRRDDLYCDCGWQQHKTEVSHDELNWIIAVVAAIIVCGVQIVLLVILHMAGSFALSYLANIVAPHFTYETITLFHWFIILSIDFIVLSSLYFCTTYLLSRKTSYPVLLALVFAFIVVPFKLFVIDPQSNIVYPMLVYIMDFLLIAVAISGGIYAKYKKRIEKELSSIEKDESPIDN
jgi:hypothetical protein